MKLSEDIVMAYADDELDAAARAQVEAAMAVDADARAQVEAHIKLRADLRSTFDAVLAEPVPERLQQAVRQVGTASSAVVSDLSSARLARDDRRQARRAWSLPQFAAIAASLMIGVLIGQRVLHSPDQYAVATREGQLVATGALDAALTRQLASNQPDAAPVHIGLTYRSAAGVFCRSFVLGQDGGIAGLACRSGNAWRLETLAGLASAGVYRKAASEMPQSIRQAIESHISGDPLDAAAERAAQSSGWR